ITEYASLANREELDKIIREHHLLKADYPLTKMLKQCDQDVRKEELAMLIGEAVERDKTWTKTGDPAPQNPVGLMAAGRPAAKDVTSAEEDRQAHPLGESELQKFPDPVAQELPSWFNADAILSAVKNRVNQLETTPKGQRWTAVSTTMGIVFANPDGLWAAIKEVSGKDAAILAADADEGAKRNLLYTIVWELSKVKDAIATEYVSEKYYTTKATIVTGGGKGFTALLVPFRANAFGESVATLEALKSPLLKKMVKEIKPKQVEVETCAI
ncbi:MAG TPA: phosphohydrolase, partial [Syntrophus sp. (in: bacteria)]|nr:phosphohydrolase [Syntrophus sp. (in: bacteria)]